jgi:rod shape determining protein RodA
MIDDSSYARTRRTLFSSARLLSVLNLDGPLLLGLGALAIYGLIILYSASGQSVDTIVRTVMRLALGTAAMLALTHASPNVLRRLAPWLYLIGVVLLLVVAMSGVIGKGAQRWLNLGLFKFQPSEIMKLAVPMLAAWYLHDRPLPPTWRSLLMLALIIFIPTALVAVEPDLGTAALIAASGALLVLMAGLSMRIIVIGLLGAVAAALLGWSSLHEYQRTRVLTFLNPQTDPLGAG